MSSFECQIQNLGVVQQNNRFRNNFKLVAKFYVNLHKLSIFINMYRFRCRRWSEVPCSKAEKVIKENRR